MWHSLAPATLGQLWWNIDRIRTQLKRIHIYLTRPANVIIVRWWPVTWTTTHAPQYVKLIEEEKKGNTSEHSSIIPWTRIGNMWPPLAAFLSFGDHNYTLRFVCLSCPVEIVTIIWQSARHAIKCSPKKKKPIVSRRSPPELRGDLGHIK